MPHLLTIRWSKVRSSIPSVRASAEALKLNDLHSIGEKHPLRTFVHRSEAISECVTLGLNSETQGGCRPATFIKKCKRVLLNVTKYLLEFSVLRLIMCMYIIMNDFILLNR